MTQHFQRRAEWVWRPRGVHAIPFGTSGLTTENERNRYVYFRRVFDISQPVQDASAWASADGRYQLFVNGQRIGRGPARCHPAHQQADPYDLRPYLRPGQNVIAALVHSYGRITAWYELPEWEHNLAFGCGGFFFQGDVVFSSPTDKSIRLDTGEHWHCLDAAAWQLDAPSGSLGFIEIYDVRQESSGWNSIEFDDSAWHPPEVLRVPGRQFVGDIIPFPHMTPRDIPLLHEEIMDSHRALYVGEVENAPPSADIANCFEQELLTKLNYCTLEMASQSTTPFDITTTPRYGVSLVIDFGRIVTGRIRFDVTAPDGAILDFTHSERLKADGRVRIHEGIPGLDVPQAHRVILREGRQTWEAFEWAGFRYLQITARNCEQPLTLHAIQINHTGYPVQENGQFECSDDLLNRVWKVGANTVRLCMHDAYIDCPSREQRQWMGDGYVEMLVNFATFGDSQLAARLLRQIAQSQLPDGLLMMCAPGDFTHIRSLNIPDFTLYWIMTLERYVQYTGDTRLIDELFPVMLKAVRWFEQYLNEDNLLTDVPHWVFVDWAELDKKGQVSALNAQFVAAMNAAANLARLIDQPGYAAHFEALGKGTAQAVNDLLWDDERGVYLDARCSHRISQQSNAAVIAFGIAPPERWSRILDVILDEKRLVLTRTGEEIAELVPFDETWQVVRTQPFYSHHLHRALSKAGRWTELLNHIRQHWGALVEAGNDTFPETWQISDLTSLCHGWASTPTYDLSTEVLGIIPLSPGFNQFRIAPQMVDLAWAQGRFPTPRGDIVVSWQRENKHFNMTVTVPEDTEAEVILPGTSTHKVGAGTHEFSNTQI